MWETSYSREPVNYKLFFLKVLKKLWLIPVSAIIGAVLIGGIYCIVKFGVGDGYKYTARTIYHVTFASDGADKEYEYYNYYTWQELIHTDYFVEGLKEALGDKYSSEEIIAATYATIESDYRYLYTKSTTGSPEASVEMEKAVSELVTKFPEDKKEIEAIEVIDAADLNDTEDVSLIFVKRAFIFGAVIGVLFFCLFSVFYACIDSSVYLPATIETRYKIKCLGAPSMKDFKVNADHILTGKNKLAFVSADGDSSRKDQLFSGNEDVSFSVRSMKKLAKDSYADAYREEFSGNYENKFFDYNDLNLDGFYDELRSAHAVILVIRSGSHNGARIERILEQLKRQDIDVTASILACEDTWLLRMYYGKNI
ncbi:MAG: hypothetical protein K5669_06900 [Lachnospiraceae bacterium]|nr:hypothetical protein [Lachnospiraceae bacterium]